jgi:hypothetical protein
VWSPAVARAAAAAGYTDFFVSDPRTKPSVVEDIRVHGRFSVIADTTPERIAALCRLSRAAIWREVAFWRARTAGKRALGPIYARRRSRILGRRHT